MLGFIRRVGTAASGFFSPIQSAVSAAADRVLRARTGKGQEQAEPYHEYRDDPVGFCDDVLGVKPWSVRDYPSTSEHSGGQREILESVRDHDKTTVSACYASGKTFIAACALLWWIYTRRPALVVTTAPTGRQVRTLLWKDVRKLWKGARRPLHGKLLQTRLQISEDWWAFGFSSDKPNSVAGLHEACNVLFIEDESAGMLPEVVEGWSGITATEGSRHLKIGNPICESGPFFDSHMNPEESKHWHQITIDAEDTPNVRKQRVVVPGLVTWDWVQDKIERWLKRGLRHLWETKVKGRFFLTAAAVVVPKPWVLEAQARFAEVSSTGPRRLGVDVAGGGQDETQVYLLAGRQVTWVTSWQTEDLMQQARDIVELAIQLEVEEIRIDRTGLGQGVWSRVVELQTDGVLPVSIDVYGLAMQSSPEDGETFAKRRDEIWFDLRWALDPTNPEALGIDPQDKQLAEELSHPTWSKADGSGKVEVESKRKMRRRGVKSTDSADAVGLLVAQCKGDVCLF